MPAAEVLPAVNMALNNPALNYHNNVLCIRKSDLYVTFTFSVFQRDSLNVNVTMFVCIKAPGVVLKESNLVVQTWFSYTRTAERFLTDQRHKSALLLLEVSLPRRFVHDRHPWMHKFDFVAFVHTNPRIMNCSIKRAYKQVTNN